MGPTLAGPRQAQGGGASEAVNGWYTRWELVFFPFLLFGGYEGVMWWAYGWGQVLQSGGHELAWCFWTLDLWAQAVHDAGCDLQQGGRRPLAAGVAGDAQRAYQGQAARTALVGHAIMFIGFALWAGHSGPALAPGVTRFALCLCIGVFLAWRILASPPNDEDALEDVV